MAVRKDWQMQTARVYRRGSLISEMMPKNPGVPQNANTRAASELDASAKVGSPKRTNFLSQGPV